MSDGPVIPPAYGRRQAQPIEDMIRQAPAVSFEDYMAAQGAPSAVVEAMNRDREQVAAIAAQLLAPGFRPLLDWLCDITLRRPMILPNLGPEAVSYVALREGQNQIVWQLLRAVAEGRSEQLEPREGV